MTGAALPGSPWLQGCVGWGLQGRGCGGPEKEPQGAGWAGISSVGAEKALERALVSDCLRGMVGVGREGGGIPARGRGLRSWCRGVGQASGKDVVCGCLLW